MRQVVLLTCVLLCGAAIAACGGGTKRAETIDTPPSSTMAPGVTTPTMEPITDAAALIADSLLTLSDMPTGWTVSPPDQDTSDDTKICGTTSTEVESAEKANATFQKSTTGPFMVEGLARFSSERESADVIARIKTAAGSCSTWTEPNDDSPITYHIAALSFPSYGDETFAFRMSSDPTIIGAIEIDLVFVRYGRVLLLVGHAGIGFSGIDSDLTQTFVEQSEAKAKSTLTRLR